MKRWTPILMITAGLALAACGGEEDEAPEAAPDTAAPSEAAAPPDTAAAPAEQPPQRGAAPAAPATVRVARVDEPWTPTDTGTIRPGMTRDEVLALWGPPVVERQAGAWTYLHFRNGCEVSCGTFDIVFLENGQVVDAIVRGEGHGYAGVSSSPPGREATPTLSAGRNG